MTTWKLNTRSFLTAHSPLFSDFVILLVTHVLKRCPISLDWAQKVRKGQDRKIGCLHFFTAVLSWQESSATSPGFVWCILSCGLTCALSKACSLLQSVSWALEELALGPFPRFWTIVRTTGLQADWTHSAYITVCKVQNVCGHSSFMQKPVCWPWNSICSFSSCFTLGCLGPMVLLLSFFFLLCHLTCNFWILNSCVWFLVWKPCPKRFLKIHLFFTSHSCAEMLVS